MPAGKACRWQHLPQILTLQLKRFQFDYLHNRYEKIPCCVDVPQKLHAKVLLDTLTRSFPTALVMIYEIF